MSANSFDLYVDSPARRPKRKRMLTREDLHYMQKIEDLANERLNFFRKQELVEKTKTNKRLNFFRKQEFLVEKTNKIKSPRPTPVTKIPKTIVPLVINKATDRLKELIVKEMKGSDIKVVIQKNLYKSDIKKGLNRLSMPINQLITDDFLTVDEKRVLNGKNPKENGIEVRLLGPTLEMYKQPMKLKMWHMVSTVNYVLMTHWYAFWCANKNCLKEDAKIQVWSFRREERLCFAVVCVDQELDDVHS